MKKKKNNIEKINNEKVEEMEIKKIEKIKIMFLLKLKDSQEYWTDKIDEATLAGFYVFETRTKAGKVQKHTLARSEVKEIIETALKDEE